MTFTLPPRGNIQDPQYSGFPSGMPPPYASLLAQLQDAMQYSGTLPGRPVNPFGGNTADRYKFGLLSPGQQVPGAPTPPPPTGAPGGQFPGGSTGGSDPPTLPPGGHNVYTGPPGTFGPKGTPTGAGPGGLLGGPGGSYGPYTPNNAPAMNPSASIPANIQAGIDHWKAMGTPQGDAVANMLLKAFSPSANINAALTHGGANQGYYADAQGNYLTPSNYGYGTGKAQTPNAAGVFSTDNGQFPGIGPNGQPAARVGPNQYAYLNTSGSNPTWGGK